MNQQQQQCNVDQYLNPNQIPIKKPKNMNQVNLK